jgi:hypothetical protein
MCRKIWSKNGKLIKIKYTITIYCHKTGSNKGPNMFLVANRIGKFRLVKCRKVVSRVLIWPLGHLWQCHTTCVSLFESHVAVILGYLWQCLWATWVSVFGSHVAVTLGHMLQFDSVIYVSVNGSHMVVALGHMWHYHCVTCGSDTWVTFCNLTGSLVAVSMDNLRK